MNALTLGNTAVRQLDGLYSLNDLHQAAGGESKHQPSNFLRNEQALALIAELSSSDLQSLNPPTKTVLGKGKQQGTYVCRELVYAYANWISPAFYLKMIRAFDAMQKVGAGEAIPYKKNPGDSLSVAQADVLRDMLKTAVEKLPHERRPAEMIAGWSKLKAHFGCAYREIPQACYAEAISILARHIAEMNRPKPLPRNYEHAEELPFVNRINGINSDIGYWFFKEAKTMTEAEAVAEFHWREFCHFARGAQHGRAADAVNLLERVLDYMARWHGQHPVEAERFRHHMLVNLVDGLRAGHGTCQTH